VQREVEVSAAMPDRARRADAQRNIDALVEAARIVFSVSGVDAPVREITTKAGVGLATFYRHFPERSDLVTAVFRHEVDACVATAAGLADQYEPVEALTRWLQQVTRFIADKYGLKPAMHSGEPPYRELPAYFLDRLTPVLKQFLDTAADARLIRSDVSPEDLMRVLSGIVAPDDRAYTNRMIDLVVDGLRYGRTAA
jgi:AcrR family transcriptional regulator